MAPAPVSARDAPLGSIVVFDLSAYDFEEESRRGNKIPDIAHRPGQKLLLIRHGAANNGIYLPIHDPEPEQRGGGFRYIPFATKFPNEAPKAKLSLTDGTILGWRSENGEMMASYIDVYPDVEMEMRLDWFQTLDRTPVGVCCIDSASWEVLKRRRRNLKNHMR